MQFFSTKQFQINESIFKEGSTGNAAYILRKGCVEISIQADGKKTVLAILKPVNVFGEMALILKDHGRIATAMALEHTELVEITRETFEKFIGSSPAFIKMILTALSDRLHHADAEITKIPNIFVATCEILNLLFEHGNIEILYDPALSAIANALSLEQKVIREQLAQMEQLDLIEVKNNATGQKIICSTKYHFLQQAMKIHEVLINFAEEKKS